VVASGANMTGLAVPPSMRAVMLGACLGVSAAFSVLGLFSSLVPTFLHGVLGVHNPDLIGGGSFLVFVTAAISQAVSGRLPARRSVSTGVPLLLVCLAALEAALPAATAGLGHRVVSSPLLRASRSTSSSEVTTRSAPAAASRSASSAREMPIAAMPPAFAAWTPEDASSITIA